MQAFDAMGQELWSTSADAPIAAVWELKNGQLKEKSLFETSVSPSSSRSNGSDRRERPTMIDSI